MPDNQRIRIGSRGSDLALWQAYHVKTKLENLGCEVSIEIIQTKGDLIQDLSFDKLEGKGFFTKELELALLQGSIDLAVHSHKDLETNPPEGLEIVAVSEREDPAELLLIHPNAIAEENRLWNLKNGGVIGTSSARRKSQVLAHRPDLIIKELRGNVPTRIAKLRAGEYDAILLAKAGVSRLNLDLSDLIVVRLDPKIMVPAPAQGVLGLQIRSNDERTKTLVSPLNDTSVHALIAIERTVLNLMEGGCQLPLGVYNDGEFIHVTHAHSAQEEAVSFKFEANENPDIAGHIASVLKARS
jgi:hydroxymethylbilane synthase